MKKGSVKNGNSNPKTMNNGKGNSQKSGYSKPSGSGKSSNPKNSSNGKGNSRGSKPTGKDDKGKEFKNFGEKAESDVEKENPKDFLNDWEWYAKFPQLLADTATIPFSWATGTALTVNNVVASQLDTIPGILTLTVSPTYGLATNPNDALNIASQSLYTFVRHQNSGSRNYDSPDLMLYVLTMTELYSYINWLQRIYGEATLYSHVNRYVPNALLLAENVEPSSIYLNLAQFRSGINQLIAKVAAFAVPATFPLIKRRAFLFNGIYKESESNKDQYYMYTPSSFFKFGLDNDGAGQLVITQIPATSPNNHSTYTDLIGFGESLIDAIFYREDIGIMSGDILKAYGSNIINLAMVPENYAVLPIYNHIVLEQMKNATSLLGVTSGNITQDPTKGWLISKPTVTVNRTVLAAAYGESTVDAGTFIRAQMALCEDRLVTTSDLTSSPEMLIENTRDMAIVINGTVTGTAGNEVFSGNVVCGSEVIHHIAIWQFSYDTTTLQYTLNQYNYSYAMATSYQGVASAQLAYTNRLLSALSAFKYAPAIRMVAYASDVTKAVEERLFFGVDNYGVVDINALTQMHRVALLSEVDVPFIALAK